jgi:hypothetical protein
MQHKRAPLLFVLLIVPLIASAGCSLGSSALPIKDDFNGSCQWPEEESAEGSADCVDGRYLVRTKRAATLPATVSFDEHVSAVLVQADAKLSSSHVGGYGAGCWTAGDSDSAISPGYFVAVASDGSYAIAHNGASGDWHALVSRGPGALELRPGTNKIRAECVRHEDATTVVLSLNGARIAVAEDPHGEGDFGRVGFVVVTDQGGTEVSFDNAEARELSEEEARTTAAMKATAEEGAGHLPLADDFSDRGSGWIARQYSDVSFEYADDAYRMTLIKPKPQLSLLTLPAGADAVAVDATAARKTGLSSAWMGVACYSSETVGYALAVSPAGKYAIRREVGGDSSVVAQGRTKPLDKPDRPVRVSAQCLGGESETTILTLAVNGTQIAVAADSEGTPHATFSSIGLYGYANGQEAELIFDDFAARELSDDEIEEIRTAAVVRPPTRQGPKILYTDKFSSAGSWPVGNDETGNLRLDGGAYRTTVRPGQNLVLFAPATGEDQSAVAVSVDLPPGRKPSLGQTFAVACAFDQDQAYTFGIEAATGRYGIWRSTDVFGPGFVHGVSSAVRKAPAVNHLVAECRGGGVNGKTRLILRVNGRKVAHATEEDGLGSFNSYGLVVGSPNGADGAFDNLIVRRLG